MDMAGQVGKGWRNTHEVGRGKGDQGRDGCSSRKLPLRGRQACFLAMMPEQEAQRRSKGWVLLSKCDGPFNSQTAFSSLAHARLPPPLFIKLFPIQLGWASESHAPAPPLLLTPLKCENPQAGQWESPYSPSSVK